MSSWAGDGGSVSACRSRPPRRRPGRAARPDPARRLRHRAFSGPALAGRRGRPSTTAVSTYRSSGPRGSWPCSERRQARCRARRQDRLVGAAYLDACCRPSSRPVSVPTANARSTGRGTPPGGRCCGSRRTWSSPGSPARSYVKAWAPGPSWCERAWTRSCSAPTRPPTSGTRRRSARWT
ncbi:hypothetical protein HBB16_16475 [Pseudonocardia sp. MCCB 268]|nr:hypothetical protein [Pseudonocardia cytotoxica]